MQNRRHDANHSATGPRAAPVGRDVDVIVLTTDFELLGMLQDAAGPEHIIWHAQSANEAVELLVGGRCGVLIADLQVLRGDAAALLERLQAQFPELVLLAMGRRDEESSIGPLVTSGRVYRFLHKPLSPARASVFISTAARRYVELSTTTSSRSIAAVRQLAQQPAPRATLLGVVVGIVVLGGLWMMREPIGRMIDSAVLEPAPQPPTVNPAIAENLAAAREAFQDGRLAPPEPDNALNRYRTVLALQSDNSEALTGVQRVLDALEQDVVDALNDRDIPRAAQAFSVLQKADPMNRDINKLREQLLALSRGKKN
jgi:hypothetical protein